MKVQNFQNQESLEQQKSRNIMLRFQTRNYELLQQLAELLEGQYRVRERQEQKAL